jgi:hypothetical protein
MNRGKTLSALLCGLLWLSGPAAARAGWMAEFGNVPLSQMVLPGAHDSATYHQAGIGISPDEPDLQWLPPALQPIVGNWGQAQALTIAQQARAGVRYFDIRVCADGEQLYTCHGVYMVPLDDVLDQLRAYLASDEARSEVVVLDLNHFYALDAGLHAALVQQLRRRLGAWAAVPAAFAAGLDSPVADFSAADRNLIIVYADPATVAANADLLWPPQSIDSPWPNLQRLWKLEQFLASTNTRSQPNQLFVHQAQLTPTLDSAIAGLLAPKMLPTSLQSFTARYTPAERRWMQTARGRAAVGNGGIIIQDFVDDWLIDYCIEQNRQRLGAAAR